MVEFQANRPFLQVLNQKPNHYFVETKQLWMLKTKFLHVLTPRIFITCFIKCFLKNPDGLLIFILFCSSFKIPMKELQYIYKAESTAYKMLANYFLEHLCCLTDSSHIALVHTVVLLHDGRLQGT